MRAMVTDTDVTQEAPAAGAPPTVTFDDTERMSRHGSPRQGVVEIIQKRLDRVLQPVDDDPVWHGVTVVTRRDLAEALVIPLPPASSQSASVATPAYIYVDATCPVCGIAGEILLTVDAKLTAVGGSRKLQLVAKAQPLPHVCGQTRVRDVTATRPVPGQTVLELGAQDPDAENVLEEEDEDLRPAGEVNVDELRGDVERAIEPTPIRRSRATPADADGDLLPF